MGVSGESFKFHGSGSHPLQSRSIQCPQVSEAAHLLIGCEQNEGRLRQELKDSDVFFSIDKQKTKMFAVDDRAWTESTKTDKLIVKAMKRGKKLVVTGTSSPGNLIKDTYSLIGFTKALSIIDKTCS